MREILLTSSPDRAGLQERLWTWRAVQALIFRCSNTEVSRWTVLRYLNSWGFRPPHAMSRSEARVAEAALLEANGYPAAKMNARQGKAFYLVECSEFALSGESQPPDPAVSIVWARGARSETAFMVVPKQELACGIIDFVGRLVDDSKGRICIVVFDDKLRLDSSTIRWADCAKTGALMLELPSEIGAPLRGSK